MGSYEYLVAADDEERKRVVAAFPDIVLTEFGGETFFLVSKERCAITGLPFLALAFGGQYNGYPPYKKTNDLIAENEIVSFNHENFMR